MCSGLFEEAARSLEEMDGEARAAPLQFRAEMLASVSRNMYFYVGLYFTHIIACSRFGDIAAT